MTYTHAPEKLPPLDVIEGYSILFADDPVAMNKVKRAYFYAKRTLILELNDEVLEKLFTKPSVRSFISYYSSYNESTLKRLISFHSFNEFLALTTQETFGSFLEAHGARLAREARALKLREYPHSTLLVRLLGERSAFQLEAGELPPTLASFTGMELLLVDKKLVPKQYQRGKAKQETALLKVKKLLVLEEVTLLTSKEELKAKLTMAVLKSITSHPIIARNDYSPALYELHLLVNHVASKRLVESMQELNGGRLHVNSALPFYDSFLEASPQLKPWEALALAHLTKEQRTVMANGDYGAFMEFLGTVLQDATPEERLLLLQQLAELSLRNDRPIPTLKQWKESHERGELLSPLTLVMKLTLMDAQPRTTVHKGLREARQFTSLLREKQV